MNLLKFFTDKWSLHELAYGVLTDGPYQTTPPFPDDIISSIRIDREAVGINYSGKCFLSRGNRDHFLACLCYMLYCVVHSENFNLAYYMAKRMEWVNKQKQLILLYGMLFTRLFKSILNENHEFYNESYVLYDRVMNALAAQQERKPRKDHGTRRDRHFTSSSSAEIVTPLLLLSPLTGHPPHDDDDVGNGKGTSHASTPLPTRYVNLLTNKVT
uniref:Pentatricopeptide repeat-containing protein n=1 Tax=Tanacetum cinerariifolium TaxID=118510 RepID=A0A6L2L0W5_TANCI|nr:hypothetical protein [Tanacetum cinerariifolium]